MQVCLLQINCQGYVEVIIGKLGMLQVFVIIPVCLLVNWTVVFVLNKKLERWLKTKSWKTERGKELYNGKN